MKKPNCLQQQNKIILFDGVCNLCSAFLHFVYRFDKKAHFKFAWIQSDEGSEILQWLGLPTSTYNTIVYIEKGAAFFKSTAFLNIVKYLTFPWPLFRIGFVLPRFFRDWIYDLVAKNRYRLFGKKETCLVPSGELRARFLTSEFNE